MLIYFILDLDVKKQDYSAKEVVFWHFPYMNTNSDTISEPISTNPTIDEMLKLKIDPLYQFVGSVTIGKNLRELSRKLGQSTKPGLMEAKLASRFSAVSLAYKICIIEHSLQIYLLKIY